MFNCNRRDDKVCDKSRDAEAGRRDSAVSFLLGCSGADMYRFLASVLPSGAPNVGRRSVIRRGEVGALRVMVGALGEKFDLPLRSNLPRASNVMGDFLRASHPIAPLMVVDLLRGARSDGGGASVHLT